MPQSSKIPPVPDALQTRWQDITAMTDRVCEDELDADYADLCRRMAAVICREPALNVQRGKVESWAAGILDQIIQLNQWTQQPVPTIEAICDRLGITKTTALKKSATIQSTLQLEAGDVAWCPAHARSQHPAAWLVSVNGLLVDARVLPRSLQEEAVRKKLIPDQGL